MMDYFRLCVALAPLSIYMIGLAVLNFRRRPVVVAGSRDMAFLGLGTIGLLLVGPIELLLPSLPDHVTGYVWMLLLVLYCLFLTLGVLLSKPRLVVYNVTLDQLRPALADAVNDLDADVRWAGGSVALPKLHVEFYFDDHPSVRNVSLVATATPQSYAGWRVLERALKEQLRSSVETTPNAWGLGVLIAALGILCRIGWIACMHPQEIAQGFTDMMRF
ncbi:MAG: hypothetical protein K8U03_23380 [Planctomycetia bacterium]|nr:hypothetical protein [Planctomycetia bacterium]